MYTKLEIKCPKHGVFFQQARAHLNGCGCPKCSLKVSKQEKLWLDSLGIPESNRQKRVNVNGKCFSVDALVNNVVYEFNGDFWHGNPHRYDPSFINPVNKKTMKKLYEETMRKQYMLESAGYTVISIWESDWNNL